MGRGLYPKGGCCKQCGSVEHLRRDCLELNKKKGSIEVFADTIDAYTSADADFPKLCYARKPAPSFTKPASTFENHAPSIAKPAPSVIKPVSQGKPAPSVTKPVTKPVSHTKPAPSIRKPVAKSVSP